MRVDLALKYLCLAKSRSSVKHLCDGEAVLVNDHPVKPSTSLRADDRITIRFPHHSITIRLLAVPEKQLSRAVSPTYYEKLAEVFTKDDDTAE